jgi:hypothetical protein
MKIKILSVNLTSEIQGAYEKRRFAKASVLVERGFFHKPITIELKFYKIISWFIVNRAEFREVLGWEGSSWAESLVEDKLKELEFEQDFNFKWEDIKSK